MENIKDIMNEASHQMMLSEQFKEVCNEYLCALTLWEMSFHDVDFLIQVRVNLLK